MVVMTGFLGSVQEDGPLPDRYPFLQFSDEPVQGPQSLLPVLRPDGDVKGCFTHRNFTDPVPAEKIVYGKLLGGLLREGFQFFLSHPFVPLVFQRHDFLAVFRVPHSAVESDLCPLLFTVVPAGERLNPASYNLRPNHSTSRRSSFPIHVQYRFRLWSTSRVHFLIPPVIFFTLRNPCLIR